MKNIIKNGFIGIVTGLFIWTAFAAGKMIILYRMQQNGCSDMNLYEYFQIDDLYIALPACAIMCPILVWVLPRLPVDKKPLPTWFENTLKIIFGAIVVLLGLLGTYTLFIDNPCQN